MNDAIQLVILPESDTDDDAYFYLLVAETGELLASHICSNAGFAKYDLFYNRPNLVKEIKRRFSKVNINFVDEIEGLTSTIISARNAKFIREG